MEEDGRRADRATESSDSGWEPSDSRDDPPPTSAAMPSSSSPQSKACPRSRPAPIPRPSCSPSIIPKLAGGDVVLNLNLSPVTRVKSVKTGKDVKKEEDVMKQELVKQELMKQEFMQQELMKQELVKQELSD